MELALIKKCKSRCIKYIKINNENDLKIIYDLWINDKVYENVNELTDICLLYYGLYYDHFVRDFGIHERYYLMAVDKGNIHACLYLGMFYRYSVRDYDKMKKYFELAIVNGNSEAMSELARYYRHIEKNEELEDKYQIMLYEIDSKLYGLNDRQLEKLLNSYKKIKNENEKLIKENDELKEKNEKLEIELECIPGYGKSYFEAKEHFTSQCK